MPAKAPDLPPAVRERAVEIGREIRARRKALGVNATVVAESVGMSRVTLHRIERGEPSVTFGAYLAVLDTLDMTLMVGSIKELEGGGSRQVEERALPLRIPLADYPQLKRLAWQLSDAEIVSPREALDIYERNWRHLETEKLEPHERQLIEALREVLQSGELRV